MIGIIDIGLCNLRSISKAIDACGFDFQLITSPDQFDLVTHCILPGVGSFKVGFERLVLSKLDIAISNFIASKRPLLGVCLGMQLLADNGDEGGGSKGLGLIGGSVRRLEPGNKMRVPHVGWNSIEFQYRHPITEGLKQARDFYFVHSFHIMGCKPESILGKTEYGTQFVSATARSNVLGVQFHPEKSQANGLKLLENFCLWDGRC